MLRRLLVVAVAVLAACTPVDDAVLPSQPDADPETSESALPEIDWTTCDGAECATVTAPLDYSDPDGATIDLHVVRLPATGERRGALWLNFGGPGSQASTLVRTWPVPDEIREHFDLVGMDPRGVGSSSPLLCGVPAIELYSADPTIDEVADADELLEVSQRFADDCEDKMGDVLPHLGTRNVARDMDLVRAMMGDERIDFIGYSYGTALGQTYADEFPQHVRTMVLDGIVDPALTGPELALGQAVGFERALQSWATGCTERSDCRLDDPASAVDRVMALAEGGIPAGRGRTLGAGEAAIALTASMYTPGLWPSLDAAVDAALSMDGSGMFDLAERYSVLVDFSVYFAVSCLDFEWPDDPHELLRLAADGARIAPRFGEPVINDYVRCPLWPVDDRPLGAITAEDAPPLLLVSTTGDAATPHDNAVAVEDRIRSARLLTHRGEGHGIVFEGQPCVDRIVVDYILDETLPTDMVC